MMTMIGTYCFVVMRMATRIVHLVSAMIMFTVLVLECFCELERTAVYES